MSKLSNKVWDHAEDIGMCMLVTQNNMSLRARPMAALVDRDEGVVRFIADRRDHKDNEIQAHPDVCVAFSKPSDETFLSMTGVARIETRPEMIRQHWDSRADAYFEHGADDENAILIEVTPSVAEFWAGPGTIAETVEMVRAALTGDKPGMGEHETVRM
jgi:general stress protein 26